MRENNTDPDMSANLFILTLLVAGSQGELFFSLPSHGGMCIIWSIMWLHSIAVCDNLQVKAETYVSGDALLSAENALVIEVEVNCNEVSENEAHTV